jgi:hypothetical protein
MMSNTSDSSVRGDASAKPRVSSASQTRVPPPKYEEAIASNNDKMDVRQMVCKWGMNCTLRCKMIHPPGHSIAHAKENERRKKRERDLAALKQDKRRKKLEQDLAALKQAEHEKAAAATAAQHQAALTALTCASVIASANAVAWAATATASALTATARVPVIAWTPAIASANTSAAWAAAATAAEQQAVTNLHIAALCTSYLHTMYAV